MATKTSYNRKSASVKRILSEAREMEEDKSTEYHAAPLEDNIFEWHFTFRGPEKTEFENGLYHGRISLPAEYPFRPPNVMMLTPNGRWELNKKICLTFTGFHEEMWQPAWGVRTALLGVQAFMSAKGEKGVGVGSLDYPEEERRRLAKASHHWRCPVCECTNLELLPNPSHSSAPAVKPTLPDGLTVDMSGGLRSETSHDAAQPASRAETDEAATSPPSLPPAQGPSPGHSHRPARNSSSGPDTPTDHRPRGNSVTMLSTPLATWVDRAMILVAGLLAVLVVRRFT